MGTDTTLLRLRELAGRLANNSAVWACGRTPWGPKPEGEDPRPTKTCDRVWECPWCSVPGLLARRADIKWRLKAAREVGSEVLFVTLNVSHGLNDALDTTVQLLEGAYDYLLHDGRRGEALKDDLGIWLIDKTVQVEWREQGFHPHYHLLVFLRPGAPAADLARVERTLTGAWHQALKATARKMTISAFQPATGVDVRPVTDGDGLAYYLTKPPVGPSGPAGLFVALVEIAEHGIGDCRCSRCRRWFMRWREYTAVMSGRKRYSAKGLDAALEGVGARPGRHRTRPRRSPYRRGGTRR